jgi:hypothetical protein
MSSSRRAARETAGKLSLGRGENRARPAGRVVWTGLLLGLGLSLAPWLAPEVRARTEGPPPSPPSVGIAAPSEEGLVVMARRNNDYQDLSPEERAKLRKRWHSLPPEKREEYRRRMERFNRLPAEERQLFRRRYQQLQKLSPGERRRLQQQLDQWDQLPPQERERIRRRFLNQRYLPGPAERPREVG